MKRLNDRFTIYNELGHLDHITVTMVGDLKFGRTVHSLSHFLAYYNVKLNYVAPASLQMPDSCIADLAARGIEQHKSEELTDAILAEVDELPQAAYFREMENGMYTRMAIISLVTGTANAVFEIPL